MKMKSNQGWLMKGFILFLSVQLFLLPVVVDVASAQSQRFGQRLIPGDGIRLTIWQPWQIGEKNNQSFDLNGDYLIDNRGYIFLPVIGEVKVTSHTKLTLEKELKDKLGVYMQDPIVVVKPLIRVAMLGAFARPGTYLVPPDASFWELVDLAGGFDDNANYAKMKIARGGKIVRDKLLKSFEKAYSLQEIGIKTGDQILVPVYSGFGTKDVLEILRFAISLLNLYIVITRV